MLCGSRVWTMRASPPRSRWRRSFARRARPAMTWAGKSSWKRSGTGSTGTVTGLWSSRRSWVLPVTGTGPDSPWMRAAPRLCGRCSSPCTKKASFIRVTGLSTGAPTASPPCPTRKWNMWISPAICGISGILLPTAAGKWWWPPPVRRPCWATAVCA